jgi:hypothetical protein
MRVVNAFIVLVLVSLPILWVSVISVSLYQAITAIYTQTDSIALHAVYGSK